MDAMKCEGMTINEFKVIKDLGVYIKEGNKTRTHWVIAQCPECHQEYTTSLGNIQHAVRCRECDCGYKKERFIALHQNRNKRYYFYAPCGKMLTNTRYSNRETICLSCDQYDVCLLHCAYEDWHGWRFANNNER